MAVQTLNIAVTPEANLTRYLQEIRKFPMLEAGEEVRLAQQLRDNDDIEAGHKLINSPCLSGYHPHRFVGHSQFALWSQPWLPAP